MITLGGRQCLMPDEYGELAKWLDRYLPLDALRDQAPSASLINNRPQSRSGNKAFVGLPLPNYPAPPPVKINTLYWPTGAARWARGYFLMTLAEIDQLAVSSETEQGHDFSRPLDLSMTDSVQGLTIHASVYPLQPRPLVYDDPRTAETAGIPGTLYLVPVVDARYFWQFMHTGDLRVDETTTWSNLYDALADRLGRRIHYDAIPAAYGQPDAQELTRRYENLALLLDAVAHSVGQRILVGYDGTVAANNAASCACIYDGNQPPSTTRPRAELEFPSLMAGGGLIYARATPESVTVTFPKYRNGSPLSDGQVYAIDVEIETTGRAIPGTSKVIHSAAAADFSSGASEPANQAQLLALAEQIRDDWVELAAEAYDFTAAGLLDWEPTCYDDHVLFHLGTPLADGTRTAYTRVQANPYWFGDEEQLQQFSDQLATTTSTSTTSTTPEPCPGRPKWEWVDADGYWAIVDDPCTATTSTTAEPTTSSTTPTTSTTTESPDPPRRRCTDTTAPPTTSSTSTSSTTTEDPNPCFPVYPDFCGTLDGQCTYTYCATNPVSTEVDCTSTSTTCDCNTTTTSTTTLPPDCSEGCEFYMHPVLGLIQLTDGCPTDRCDCPDPVGLEPCEYETTACEVIPPGPDPGPCVGYCDWWWLPAYSDTATANWYLAGHSCEGGTTGCFCVPPDIEGGDYCASYQTRCQSRERPGPCAGCYSSTSTTTADPCGSGCFWEAMDAGGFNVWDLATNDCEPECDCYPPASAPEDDCDTAKTKCWPGVTSTTTSTTPPPTTTTEPPEWYCIPLDDDPENCGDVNDCDEFPAAEPPEIFCGGPWATQGECEAECTTSTTPTPVWYCLRGEGPCGGGTDYCSEMSPDDPPSPGDACSGPHFSEEVCLPACTSTTTTEEPYYCCASTITGCDDGDGVCSQGGPCGAREPFQFFCAGPFELGPDCESGCGEAIATSTSTTAEPTTSTTPDPECEFAECGQDTCCQYFCSGGVWVRNMVGSGVPPTICETRNPGCDCTCDWEGLASPAPDFDNDACTDGATWTGLCECA